MAKWIRWTYPRGTSERDFEMDSDGYKYSHWMFQDHGVTENYDYLTSRGGMFDDLTMFGGQAMLMKHLVGRRVTPASVKRTQKKVGRYFNNSAVFNYDAWMDIATRLKGRIPVRVWALPDGLSAIPVQTPLVTYVNTDPKHSAISGFLEPLKLQLWNPITIASLSQHIKKMIYQFLIETGTPEAVKYMLHDFGLRGVSSMESAEIAGAAHGINFVGSDTFRAVDFINEFYSNGIFDDDGDPTYMPFSTVVATEHSVMTQRGPLGEPDLVKEILRRYPTGIISMVGDSYNIFKFAEEIIGTGLHTEVIERAGIVVIRPDSGEPVATMMKVMWHLGQKFQWTVNQKGYRNLGTGQGAGKIKVLQGDKNDYEAIYAMLRAFKGAQWSADNIGTFGMGGALLQASTRDTQKMAVKLSSMTKDGEWVDVQKDPITDPGKGSKPGRFAVVYETNPVTNIRRMVTKKLRQGQPEPDGNLLREAFYNGELMVHENYERVRERADEWMAPLVKTA
jgi:nicotinamide phosphoribosyltransferase